MKVVLNAVSQLGSLAALMLLSSTAHADADGWFDITVLHARVLPGVTLKTFDHVEDCKKVKDESSYLYGPRPTHVEEFDCEAYFNSKMYGTAFKRLPRWIFHNGRLQTDLSTPIVEVLTVTPVDRLAQSSAIGFSESYLGGRVNFFRSTGSDGQTREASQVELKDGRIGIVHRFYAAFEANGNTYGQTIRTLPFKPVLVRNGIQYWDRLIGEGTGRDYVITNFDSMARAIVAPGSYDRSAELLK